MRPDLSKERRFALLVGIVLFVYVLGAKIPEGATLQPLGIPMEVKPIWISVGLFLTSAYSVYVYWFAGFVRSESPKHARDILTERAQLGIRAQIASKHNHIKTAQSRTTAAKKAHLGSRRPQTESALQQREDELQKLEEGLTDLEEYRDSRKPFSRTVEIEIPPSDDRDISEWFERVDAAFPPVFGNAPIREKFHPNRDISGIMLTVPTSRTYYYQFADIDYWLPIGINGIALLVAIGVGIWSHFNPGCS